MGLFWGILSVWEERKIRVLWKIWENLSENVFGMGYAGILGKKITRGPQCRKKHVVVEPFEILFNLCKNTSAMKQKLHAWHVQLFFTLIF